MRLFIGGVWRGIEYAPAASYSVVGFGVTIWRFAGIRIHPAIYGCG